MKKISSKGPSAPLPWDEAVAAFEQDLLAHGRSEATARTYGSALRTFGRYYRDNLNKPGPYPRRLGPGDLHAFVAHLRRERRLSAASVNRFVAALHSFCRFALERRWLRQDIAAELRTYHVSTPDEPVRLKPLEVQRLLAAAGPHSRNGLRDQAMLQLLLQTGLRLGELAALSVGDVVLRKSSGRVRIRGTKGRGDRTVPLNSSARGALQRYLNSRGEPADQEPLFVSERRGRLGTGAVHHLVKKYLSFAGRPKLSAHDMRHHFATQLYAKTGKLTAVQKALGHRSIVTTSRYARTSSQELVDAIEGLRDNIAPESEGG